MKTNRLYSWLILAGMLSAGACFAAPNASITVDAQNPTHKVSPMLWGIFFEDINLSADGGIYAELVRNRSFEDSDKPEHWSTIGSGSAKVEISVDNSLPISPKNPRSLKVTIQDTGTARAGVANNGYWGMALKKGDSYDLSLWARGSDGFTGPLTVTLESTDSIVYAKETINRLTPEWKRYQLKFTSTATDPRARLVISTTKTGTFWLDMVSLFPKKTWKNRPNGLRPDLFEMLLALKPSFVRFPGGCWVEGNTMKEAYRWKETIGDISERRTQYNIWHYYATHGLGFHEYLLMCEDLGAEPLFVINCGMSHRENVPLDKMDEYVQDALDAIEYCNGPVTSKWGALRAAAGHPAPFNLKYMEIGNENGGRAYHERWPLFYKAIKAKYPEIQLIANVWGGYPTNIMPEIIDEHYYSNPEFFINRANMYDKYNRNGPKVYVGEYAVTQDCGQGNLRGAIGEAAFMTGMERNSDIVYMASYAPLFVNVNHRRWNPNLINFDSSRVYGIPSYYVQKLFSEYRGEEVLPITVESPFSAVQAKGGAVGVGTWMTEAEFKDIKVTRNGETLLAPDLKTTQGWRLHGGQWQAENGVLRQTSRAENVRAIIGDKKWTNYTFSLKARKLAGNEGFLILFAVQNDNAKSWWNIGGWGNQRHAIEMGGIIGNEVPGKIETGRWYDIRVELQGSRIKCYLDGQLLHDVEAPTPKALYASATRDNTKRELILKVVNVSYEPVGALIKLNGAAVAGTGEAIVLTSDDAADENSLENPTKVAPRSSPIKPGSGEFQHTFPPNSLTVLRLKSR